MDHRYNTSRETKRSFEASSAAALPLQSHNLWHRRGEAVEKKKEEEERKEQGGRLTVKERERDRSAADIKIPTREK